MTTIPERERSAEIFLQNLANKGLLVIRGETYLESWNACRKLMADFNEAHIIAGWQARAEAAEARVVS